MKCTRHLSIPVVLVLPSSCGLIRQAQHDLQEFFGFRLPRWNQAFMFDTLSSSDNDWENLKPGDLVFYEGTTTY